MQLKLENNFNETIKALSEHGLVFGGSFALNLVGLLNREIKDLDVITNDQALFDKLNNQLFNPPYTELPQDKNDHESISLEFIDGEPLIRKTLKINDVNICLFKRDKIEYFEVNYNGETIKIQNILDILKVKAAYSKLEFASGNKHQYDLKYVEEQKEACVKTTIKEKKTSDELPF